MTELFVKNKTLFEILFYTTIFAAVRALITPDLFNNFPHYNFIRFFALHLTMLLAIFFIAMRYEFRLTWISVIKSWFAFLVYAVMIFFYNIITDSNYLYLGKRTVFKTELDYLGPYPYYFITAAVLMFGLFAVIHLIYSGIYKVVVSDKECVIYEP